MEKQALLKRGFIENSWTDEEETFTEFILETPTIHIQIYGIDTVEIKTYKEWIEVPNCKTIKDLDDLIRLFK